MIKAAFFLLLIPSAVFASPIYSVTAIPIPSGFTNVQMSGINNAGQTAGFGTVAPTTPVGVFDQAFIGSPSGSTAIPFAPGAVSTVGESVNASGLIVGFGGQGFVGTPSGSTNIPVPVGFDQAAAYGVNDSGEVVGDVIPVNNSTLQQAYIGTTSGSTVVPLLAGWSSSLGFAINNSGQITGDLSGNLGSGPSSQAFIGTAAGLVAIPLPSGWFFTGGFAINSAGEVAGIGSNGTSEMAFVGTASGTTVIPLPVGATNVDLAFGDALNDLGMVVGSSDVGGWIWSPTTGTVLLNTLVPAGWNVESGIGISNNGLILAEASFDGGPEEFVELTPAPEPGTFFLAGVGLLVVSWARLRVSRARKSTR